MSDNTVTLVEWKNSENHLIDRDYIRPKDNTTLAHFLIDKLRNEWAELEEGDVIAISSGWQDDDEHEDYDGQPDEAQEWHNFDPDC